MAYADHADALAYFRRRNEFNAALVDSYMDECVDCGNDDPDVLQFDHVSAGAPYGSLHKAARHGHHDGVARELEYGDVRCANCHSKRHKEDARAIA